MGEGRKSGNRLSVYDAAEVMGVTVDAVRKRVARGTIPHERGEDGRVWVLLDIDQYTASKVQDTDRPQSEPDALISEMRARIEDLRGQLEAERQAHAEARRIIAGLVERIPPAIEAPESSERPGPTHTPQDAGEGPQEATESSQERPWWRRVFGG